MSLARCRRRFVGGLRQNRVGFSREARGELVSIEQLGPIGAAVLEEPLECTAAAGFAHRRGARQIGRELDDRSSERL